MSAALKLPLGRVDFPIKEYGPPCRFDTYYFRGHGHSYLDRHVVRVHALVERGDAQPLELVQMLVTNDLGREAEMLVFGVEQVRVLAARLLLAADDAEAALAVVQAKQGGAA